MSLISAGFISLDSTFKGLYLLIGSMAKRSKTDVSFGKNLRNIPLYDSFLWVETPK